MNKEYLTLAFYKSEYGGVLGKLINWWTKYDKYTWRKTANRFNHVELIFSDGMSFSSQEKKYSDGSPAGVRLKKIKYSHPERWLFVRFPLVCSEKRVRNKAESILGAKYDWKGILLYQFLPFGLEDANSWYCSECTSWALYLEPYKLNPNNMFDKVIQYVIDENMGNESFPQVPF